MENINIRRLQGKMILVILGGCLILRLFALNQSLWLDEAISANVARNFSLFEIVKNFSVNDFHPPFYYLFLNIWGHIFGYSEISLRLPSVIFSLITIYLVYLIGKLLKDKNTGLWAAAIVGVNPLLIYFSQEVRMYSMVTMFLTLALYNFLKIVKTKNYNYWNIIGINIFSFLSFVTFYGSVFLIASFGIYFLAKKKFKILFLSNIGIILAIITLLPLVKIQMLNSKQALINVVNWELVLGRVNLKNLFLIPIKFSIGRISFNPKILYYFISGIWTGFIFIGAFKNFYKNKLLIFLFLTPLILGLLFSFYSPLLQYFRFLYLIPILGLLIALNKIDFIKTISVSGFLIFSFIYIFNNNFYREDWKSLAKTLNNNSVYMISSFSDPVIYYKSSLNIHDLRNKINETEIYVIPYGELIHGVNHNEILSQQNYRKIEEKDFRGVTIEKWQLQ